MQFVMHSYTFRAYPLREAFLNARRFGWDGIELQPCHFNRDRIDAELPAAIAAGREFGVPIACVDFGGDFINADPAIVEKDIRQMEREIDACAQSGVKLMNGGVGSLVVEGNSFGENGSALATAAHYERAAEAMRHLGARASQYGVTIVFEIHMNGLTDTVASTARLLDLIALDNVKANPDCGNMFATSTAEKDPEALDALRGRIGYFHFKNCRLVGTEWDFSVRLADGHIDVYKWLDKLAAMKYDGPICVEYCGAGDPRLAAKEDIEYVKRSLGWVHGRG